MHCAIKTSLYAHDSAIQVQVAKNYITYHEKREDGLADEVIDQKESHTGEDTGQLGEDLVTRTHSASSMNWKYY